MAADRFERGGRGSRWNAKFGGAGRTEDLLSCSRIGRHITPRRAASVGAHWDWDWTWAASARGRPGTYVRAGSSVPVVTPAAPMPWPSQMQIQRASWWQWHWGLRARANHDSVGPSCGLLGSRPRRRSDSAVRRHARVLLRIYAARSLLEHLQKFGKSNCHL